MQRSSLLRQSLRTASFSARPTSQLSELRNYSDTSSSSSPPSSPQAPSSSSTAAPDLPRLFLHSIPSSLTPEACRDELSRAGIPTASLTFRPPKTEDAKFRLADCVLETEEAVQKALKLSQSKLPFLVARGREPDHRVPLPSAVISSISDDLNVHRVLSRLDINIVKVTRRPNGSARVIFANEEDKENALKLPDLPFEFENAEFSPQAAKPITLEELFPNLLSKGYDPISSLDPSFKPPPPAPRKPLSYQVMPFEFQLGSAKEEINEEVLVSVKVNVSDLEADIPPAGQEKL